MLLFLDTEFTDFIDCDLISIGIVSEDGREFYGERTDFDLAACSAFVKEAVLPKLAQEAGCSGSEAELGKALRTWLSQFRLDAPIYVYVDYPTDWDLFVYLCRHPDTLEMPKWIEGRSIRDAIDASDIERYWQSNGRMVHHALHDAKALRFAYFSRSHK